MANTWWVAQLRQHPDEWYLIHSRDVPPTEEWGDEYSTIRGPFSEKSEAGRYAKNVERAKYVGNHEGR